MDPIWMREKPLNDYLELIRNSFNSNNYVFEVHTLIKKEGNIEDKIKYISKVGFDSYQKLRKGKLIYIQSKQIKNVDGIREFIDKLRELYLEKNANFISTELYDTLHINGKVLIEYYT